MSDVAAAIHDLLADHRPFHSNLQIDRFILAQNGGTAWGCYQQALREIASRWESVKGDALRREELLIDLDEACGRAGRWWAPRASRRRAGLAVRRAQAALDGLDRESRDRARELARFIEHAQRIKAGLGRLTDEVRDELDARTWTRRLAKQAAIDVATTGAIASGTLQAILCLDPPMRRPLLDLLEAHRRPDLLAHLEDDGDAVQALGAPDAEVMAQLTEAAHATGP